MKQIQHKYKKPHKPLVKYNDKESKRLSLLYGLIGLRAVGVGRLTSGQLESMRRTIKKVIKKDGTLWFRVVLDRALTAKPAEVRMGKGKGSFSENISLIKAGRVLFEIGGEGYQEKKALLAMDQVQKKLPFKTEILRHKL